MDLQTVIGAAIGAGSVALVQWAGLHAELKALKTQVATLSGQLAALTAFVGFKGPGESP